MKHGISKNFLAALRRLDIRIHREILRLRSHYQLSLDEFRGLYISDQQVDALLRKAHQEGVPHTDIDEITRCIHDFCENAWSALGADSLWQTLRAHFLLSRAEEDILLICLAPELDAKYEILYAYLNNDITRKYPTVDLILRLAEDEEKAVYRQALFSDGKLRQSQLLVDCGSNASQYQLQTGFRLSAVLRDFLLGGPLAQVALENLLEPVAQQWSCWEEVPYSDETLVPFIQLAEHFRQPVGQPTSITAPRQSQKLLLLAQPKAAGEQLVDMVYRQGARRTVKLQLGHLAKDKTQLVEQLNRIYLYLRLTDAAVIVNFHDDLSLDSESAMPLAGHIIDALFRPEISLTLIMGETDKRQGLLIDHQYQTLVLKSPDGAERRQLWSYFVTANHLQGRDDDISAVAQFFNLDYRQIKNACANLAMESRDNPLTRNALFGAATAQSYSEITSLATKVSHGYSFNDLILPPEILNRVREVIAATRNRRLIYEDWGFGSRLGSAKGIMALFSGASGTGKTMSASVIANEIGLDIYRIDLSRTVSKYIGETEKNLDKIFTAAQQANCILFFDEADALFGKRSEVKDAHDRYANVEVAYLLQKMEEHDGVVILTTNLAKNIDPAFSRRLQFIIEFPRPDETHRELIWKSMFTSKAPLQSDVDFKFLARQFHNTGGDIKNIVLDAAMLAAESAHKTIDMPLLIRASARHMVKQGKVPSATEFKHFFGLVTTAG